MKNLCRVIIISLIFIFFLVNSSFAVLTGTNAWKIVKLMNRYTDADPLFSVSSIRLSLFKNTLGYLSGYKIHPTNEMVVLSANQVEYTYLTSYVPLTVHAVRRLTQATGNFRSLTSVSVGDINKVSKVSSGYPEFYYFWKNIIGFAPPPTVTCSMWVFGYSRELASIVEEGSELDFTPPFNHIFYFYLSSLYKEREGNVAAASNLRQIAQSMLYDMLQIYQMAEQSVDLKIAPEIYEE